jgi:hypothetical protein
LAKVKHFIEFKEKKYGVLIDYKRGFKRVLLYKPNMRFAGKKDFEGINILDRAFPQEWDKKKKKYVRRIPRSYKDIKAKLYEELPQWFRSQLSEEWNFKPVSEETPKPICELRVFVYHKNPESYRDKIEAGKWHEIIIHMLDIHKLAAPHKIYFGDSYAEHKLERERVSESEVQPNAKMYVHRYSVWFKQSGKKGDKAEYKEQYFTDREEVYGDILKVKLHHVRGELMSYYSERDYKPLYGGAE